MHVGSLLILCVCSQRFKNSSVRSHRPHQADQAPAVALVFSFIPHSQLITFRFGDSCPCLPRPRRLLGHKPSPLQPYTCCPHETKYFNMTHCRLHQAFFCVRSSRLFWLAVRSARWVMDKFLKLEKVGEVCPCNLNYFSCAGNVGCCFEGHLWDRLQSQG